MSDDTDVFDAHEAAKYLKLNPQTIRRLARNDEMPAFKVGGSWRFRKATLDRWAESQHARPRRRTILVVDDEQPIRDVLARVLEMEGFRVLTAPGGTEGLEILQRDTPDLVILDLRMPGMDGPTMLQEIRRGWGTIPVVILTGYPDSELMNRAMEYSPITLLAKPAAAEKIAATVKGILWVRQGRDVDR